MASLAVVRARYARQVTAPARAAGRDTARVEAAFSAVLRERCLPPPPWQVFAPGEGWDRETSDPAALYDDVLVVLDRASGINNGQPSLHAAWLAETGPRPGETVVQVGIGAGYYTAILAELVTGRGRVDAYEINARLAALARENLLPWAQVRVHGTSGTGVDLPSADVVYVSAGSAAPDPAWLRCLRPGGRLVFPWQPDGRGHTLFLIRVGHGFRAALGVGVSFVGCVGAGQPGCRKRDPPLRPIRDTRSAWLTADCAPDATATAIYGDVWFSADRV